VAHDVDAPRADALDLTDEEFPVEVSEDLVYEQVGQALE
jgi:hypothetical protein